MPTWKTKKLKTLAKALLSLNTEKDMLSFLRDIATTEELTSLSERLHVATLLKKGFTYRNIAKQTGLSTTTITRVAHWIKEGEGGYNKVLD